MRNNPALLLPSQAHLFTLDPAVTYLNCAYKSPLLRTVEQAGLDGIRLNEQPWNLGAEMFFEQCEQFRPLAGKLIGCDHNHIAIIPSASYGLAVAARNLEPRVEAGQNILVLAEEFPSNYYVWKNLADRKGLTITTVAQPADGDWTKAVLAAINKKTVIIALPNCHWTDGTLVDLAAIRQAIGKPGDHAPYLVLDLTQSLGALPFDVSAIEPDFMVAATYKWAMCPYGMGVLYVADHFLNGEPIEYNWVNRNRSENLARLVEYCDEYQPGARRYDAGERSNPILLPMAIAAFKQLLEWGVERTHATIHQLTTRLLEQTSSLPLTTVDSNFSAGHMIGLRLQERWPDALRDKMREANIHVSYRGTGMRISPHLYNDAADIDKLADFLKKHL